MARLVEHQGKRLLAKAGIAVPKGAVAQSPDEAAAAATKLGYPVALKAQVPSGGRGKAGGILFARDEPELRANAALLFGRKFHNYAVTELLVEEKLDIRGELYVAVISDPTRRAPAILFSQSGGVEVEGALESGGFVSETVDILRGVPPHVGINLVRQTGIPSRLMAPLGRVIASLYRVYRENDCTLAEINPLAITPKGVVALDARIEIDDDSVFRHPELGLQRSLEVGDRLPTELERIAARIDEKDHRGSTHFIQVDPDGAVAKAQGKISIGFDGVGTGVSLAAMDELVPLGFFPKNFCDTSGNPTGSKLYRITRVILAQEDIEGYVFISCLSSQQLDNTARGLIKAFKEIYPNGEPNFPCVFCFRGAWDDDALAMMAEHGVTKSRWVKTLGRYATERDVAVAFRDLHAAWRRERVRA